MKTPDPSSSTRASRQPSASTLATRRAATLIQLALLLAAVLVGAALIWMLAGLPVGGAPTFAALPALPTAAVATAAVIVPTPVLLGGLGGQAGPTPTLFVEPTQSPTPTATLEPPTATPVAPTAEPPPATVEQPTAAPSPEQPITLGVNGVPYEAIIVMPEDVRARAREIFLAGRALGRNPNAYSRVGDSTVENPHFMARFDSGPYNLGQYAYLQPAIDHFLGSHGRDSVAVRVGLHAWTALDPAWADKPACEPNETPVACEIRLHNPSILLIRLGTNDVGVPEMFDAGIRQIVETAVAAGVIPVIGTKGDRHEGSNENNDILRRIAADYRIPLWDYDVVAGTLPGRGLDVDDAHMKTFFAHDYTDPTAFTRGHAMHNLTALMMLDALRRTVILQ